MNSNMVKELFDACFLAKRVLQMLPSLPEGMVPRHIHIMDAVHQLADEKEKVYVGDVSALMHCTTPSVTRLIGELEALGYVTKTGVPGDKRHVAVGLSKKGEDFHSRYVAAYHGMLADALSDLDDGDCRAVTKVMTAMHDRMRRVTKEFSGQNSRGPVASTVQAAARKDNRK